MRGVQFYVSLFQNKFVKLLWQYRALLFISFPHLALAQTDETLPLHRLWVFWGLEHQTNKIPTSCVTGQLIISSCLRFLIHKMNLYGDRTRVMEKVGGIKEIWLSQYHVFGAVALNLCSVVFLLFLTLSFFIFWNKWFFKMFCKHFFSYSTCFFILWTMSFIVHCFIEQKFSP